VENKKSMQSFSGRMPLIAASIETKKSVMFMKICKPLIGRLFAILVACVACYV
jgi:hypothetical protein